VDLENDVTGRDGEGRGGGGRGLLWWTADGGKASKRKQGCHDETAKQRHDRRQTDPIHWLLLVFHGATARALVTSLRLCRRDRRVSYAGVMRTCVSAAALTFTAVNGEPAGTAWTAVNITTTHTPPPVHG